ncbi:MAG: hybrid-cluster NAD(P)-dependent oxidoreductase [Halopseudomonas sp.]
MSSIRVSQLSVYPIKSTSGIHLNHALVEEKGLAFDRRFVVARPDGRFITARSHPKLLQLHSALIADGLHIKAPDMEALDLYYSHFDDDYCELTIWSDALQGQHCGQQADDWFSRYMGEPLQLLFFGSQSHRQRASHRGINDGQVSFADGYPLLLISQASLDDLNQRLETAVGMEQFRPNLVLKGCPPFAEDSWQRIRIGEVEFELTTPCSRCILTTIDPVSAQADARQQPLATLARYRKGDDGQVYFGQNLVALNRGKISLYDPVEVLQTRTATSYPDDAPLRVPSPPPLHRWQPGELATLECVAIRLETEDVKTLVFKMCDPLTVHYQPGQFIGLELELDGVPLHRNYTLSSPPSRPDRLSITVKRVEGGRVSNWLNDQLAVGDQLRARAPAGDFHCFVAPQDKLLLLSAGSGITPMLSMLRWMTDLQLDNDIVFLHSAHSEKDLIARQEIELLAKQHGRCEVIYTLTQAAAGELRCFRGRLDRSMLETVSALSQRQVYVCGPHPFMARAKQLLEGLGLPESHYFEESFGVREGDRGTVAAPPKAVKILFDSWDSLVDGDSQRTLLEQAEQAGVAIPFSCRGGFCGSCRVKLESGEVEVLEDSGLNDTDKSAGYVLACSCRPKTDLVITQG